MKIRTVTNKPLLTGVKNYGDFITLRPAFIDAHSFGNYNPEYDRFLSKKFGKELRTIDELILVPSTSKFKKSIANDFSIVHKFHSIYNFIEVKERYIHSVKPPFLVTLVVRTLPLVERKLTFDLIAKIVRLYEGPDSDTSKFLEDKWSHPEKPPESGGSVLAEIFLNGLTIQLVWTGEFVLFGADLEKAAKLLIKP